MSFFSKNTKKIDTSHTPSHFWGAILVVLVFLSASISAVTAMQYKNNLIPYNNISQLEAYFETNVAQLTQKQKQVIQNSVIIETNTAEDAGIEVALQAVCGNGYYTMFQLTVAFPEEKSPKNGFSFERIQFLMNDNESNFGNPKVSTRIINDETTADNVYCLQIVTMLDYEAGKEYPLHNGIVRTLHLQNIRMPSDNGESEILVEGTWDLSVLFPKEIKKREALSEPIKIRQYDPINDAHFAVDIESFVVTEYSAHAELNVLAEFSKQNITNYIEPTLILQNGEVLRLEPLTQYANHYSSRIPTPISLDEVAFLRLTDYIYIPFTRYK